MKAILLLPLLAILLGCSTQDPKVITRTRTYYIGVSPAIAKQRVSFDNEVTATWGKAYASWQKFPKEKRAELVKANEPWEDYSWARGYSDAIEALVFSMDLEEARKGEEAMAKMRAEREKIP